MIQGEIHILPLTDLVQWLALTRRTGTLTVTRDRFSVEIFFAKGEISAAADGERAILDNPGKVFGALSTALALEAGHFVFNEGVLPLWVSTVNLHLSAEALLHNASPQHSQPQATGRLNAVAILGRNSGLLNPAETLRVQITNQLMREDISLPAMPQLATRVLQLTRQPNYSLRDLGNAILADQAVVVRLLRYANSARQGSDREIDTLAQALQRLGTDEVVNVVLAASLQARRLGRDPFAEEKRRLWLHSSTAAMLASALATQLRLERNVAFLCGLLMDFGMNVLYSVIQDILIRQNHSDPFPPQMVQQIIQDFHPSVGRLVGEKWQLPTIVIQAMAKHHCVEEMKPENPYIAISAVADYLADFALGMPRAALEETLPSFTPERLTAHPAAQSLKLDAQTAATILAQLPLCVDQARELVVT